MLEADKIAAVNPTKPTLDTLAKARQKVNSLISLYTLKD
jgi:hypothetical protein